MDANARYGVRDDLSRARSGASESFRDPPESDRLGFSSNRDRDGFSAPHGRITGSRDQNGFGSDRNREGFSSQRDRDWEGFGSGSKDLLGRSAPGFGRNIVDRDASSHHRERDRDKRPNQDGFERDRDRELDGFSSRDDRGGFGRDGVSSARDHERDGFSSRDCREALEKSRNGFGDGFDGFGKSGDASGPGGGARDGFGAQPQGFSSGFGADAFGTSTFSDTRRADGFAGQKEKDRGSEGFAKNDFASGFNDDFGNQKDKVFGGGFAHIDNFGDARGKDASGFDGSATPAFGNRF